MGKRTEAENKQLLIQLLEQLLENVKKDTFTVVELKGNAAQERIPDLSNVELPDLNCDVRDLPDVKSTGKIYYNLELELYNSSIDETRDDLSLK